MQWRSWVFMAAGANHYSDRPNLQKNTIIYWISFYSGQKFNICRVLKIKFFARPIHRSSQILSSFTLLLGAAAPLPQSPT